MQFTIEKGIPLPPIPKSRDNTKKYPWHLMEIGDSFFVRGKTMHEMTRCVNRVQARCNKKWAVRTVSGGARMWRIA